MFSFRKRKLHVKAVNYQPEGWIMEQSDRFERRWQCPDFRAIFQINCLAQAPDLPAKGCRQPQVLQDFFRQSALKYNGGLLQADCIQLQGLTAIKNIIKAPQAQGMRYLGAYLFPFKRCSFGLKFITEEFEQQGLRESMMAAEFFDGQQKPSSFEAQAEAGWWKDPYDPTIRQGTPMNQAEQLAYDERFPNHPLSRLRQWMATVEEQLLFEDSIYQLKPFYSKIKS